MLLAENNKKLKKEDASIISSEAEVLNGEQEEIIHWLKDVKFEKQLIGGVKEEDVWKKIHELNKMYEVALEAERIRYDVLLEEQKKKGEFASQIKESKEA